MTLLPNELPRAGGRLCGAALALALLLAFGGPAAAQTKSTKRGVAYGYNSAADLRALAPGLAWWYNWYSKPEAGAAPVYAGLNVDYAPMQWGSTLDGGALTADKLAANVPAGAKYLLGFNEPNFLSQANLTPTQAAKLWPVLQEVARRKGLKLVSPALNYCGSCVSENGVTYYSPTQYLDAFFAACPTCQVDYIAVHTYVCQEQYLREKIGELKKYGKPIWLTEFACGDMPASQITLDLQKTYLTAAVNYLENEPAVFRYAWFSGRNNEIPYVNLLGADGQLTELGKLYVGLPAASPGAAAALLQAENYSNMSGVQVETTSDTGGGQDVGYIDAGDWLLYNNVAFPAAGSYTVEYRVASPSGGTLSADLNAGKIQLGKVVLPATGGWQTWQTVTQTVTVATAGTYSFGINAQAGGWNINWLRITRAAGAATAARGGAPAAALDVVLYPNPADSQLTLTATEAFVGGEVRIYDATGRQVWRGPYQGQAVPVAGLKTGLYTLEISHAGQTKRLRFAKQ